MTAIVTEICRHHATVCREINRNRYVGDELPKLIGYDGMAGPFHVDNTFSYFEALASYLLKHGRPSQSCMTRRNAQRRHRYDPKADIR